VHLPALPLGVADGRGERHPPLLLVLLPVRDRRPLLDRAQAVRLPGLEEQSLGERRLPRPAVADDGDVADLAGLEHSHARFLLGGFDGSGLILTASQPLPGRLTQARTPPARCAFRRRIAFVCSCETRDSVTPS